MLSHRRDKQGRGWGWGQRASWKGMRMQGRRSPSETRGIERDEWQALTTELLRSWSLIKTKPLYKWGHYVREVKQTAQGPTGIWWQIQDWALTTPGQDIRKQTESRRISLGSKYKKITCLTKAAEKKARINFVLLGGLRACSLTVTLGETPCPGTEQAASMRSSTAPQGFSASSRSRDDGAYWWHRSSLMELLLTVILQS